MRVEVAATVGGGSLACVARVVSGQVEVFIKLSSGGVWKL
jgi:hypothetical protein